MSIRTLTLFAEDVWFWEKIVLFVSGNRYGFFSSSRGLRQGDHFLPYLFVIVIDALIRMLSASVNVDFLFGFFVGSRLSDVVNISHLFFADDTLVFCGATLDHLRDLYALFLCFEGASRPKINLAK